MKHRLIAINASSPGSGKTTLGTSLVDDLLGRGIAARWLGERDLIARDAFARCGAALMANAPAAIELSLAAAQALVAEHSGRDEAWGIDSMLPGFVFCLGRNPLPRVERYRNEVAKVFRPLDPLLVYLTGDQKLFLERATARSGPAFADRLVAALGRIELPHYPAGPIQTIDDTHQFFAWTDHQTRALLRGWPGPVLVLDAGTTSAEDWCAILVRSIT